MSFLVNVKDYSEVAERMSLMKNYFPKARDDCMLDAIKTVFREPIMIRTPMSTLQNPIYQNKDGKIKPYYKGKIGKMNLRNDFDRTMEKNGNTMPFTVGFANVDYASYVHQMTGANVRWSTPGTGALFLSQPIEDNNDKMLEEFMTNMDFALKERGIL